MLVGEAVAALNLTVGEGLDPCVVLFREDGKKWTGPLGRALRAEMNEYAAAYMAGGLFERGVFTNGRGRSWENVREVMWLSFDADLKDFTGMDPAILHDMTPEAIDRLTEQLTDEVRSVFDAFPLPLHRLDATGYGVCAYVMLHPSDRHRTEEIRDYYRMLVRSLNERAGGHLFDPQNSDAGTRINRIPGSLNRKGEVARTVRTIQNLPGYVGVDGLGALLGPALQRRSEPRPVIPNQQIPPGLHDTVIAALVPGWTEGARHALALGLAGMLAKAGVAEEEAEGIVRGIAERAGDEDMDDRLLAVRTTYMRARGGRDVRGFWALQEAAGAEAVAAVDAVLEPLRRATSPTILLGTTVAVDGVERERPRFTEPPDAAWRGWIGEYMAIMAPTTEAADAFHLGTGLAVAGAAMGRRVQGRYAGSTVFPNLYCLLIGSAGGSRKDTAISRGVYWPRVMERGGFMGAQTASPYYLFSDAGSSQALIDVLAEHPGALLYLSEFARLTRNARRQGTSDLIPTLLHAFDNPPALEVVSRGKPAVATEPCLSIIAAIQPDILSIEFGENDTASGFTSRLLYFCGEGKPDPLPDPPAPDGVALAALYRRLLDVREAGAVLEVATDAKEAWDAFYFNDKRRQVEGVTQDTMRTRLALLVRRVALVYAATEGASCIGREHLEAAIAVIEWQWDNVCRLSVDWGASVGRVIRRRVLDVLRLEGAMPRSVLEWRVDSVRWGPEQFASVMRAMLENGSIVQDAAGTVALGRAVQA